MNIQFSYTVRSEDRHMVSISPPSLFSKATASTLQVMTITANTLAPLLQSKDLSPEDKEAREKGLQLVVRIEQLCQNDERFRQWIQEGIDDIEAGRTITFSEDGWKED